MSEALVSKLFNYGLKDDYISHSVVHTGTCYSSCYFFWVLYGQGHYYKDVFQYTKASPQKEKPLLTKHTT